MLQELANTNEFSLMALLILFFTATGTGLVWLCSRQQTRGWLAGYEGVVPPFIGIPAVMFSLTAALMATSLWEHYSGAAKAIRLESQGIESYVQLAETVPQLKALGLTSYAKSYAHSVLQDEWPTMADTGASPQTERQFQALQIATFRAANQLGSAAEVKVMMNAYQHIHDGRSARLGYVAFDVHPIRWVAVLGLAILLQLAIAVVHLSKPKALAVAMTFATLTILTALCTIALTLSNPYVGIVSVSNSAYLQAFK